MSNSSSALKNKLDNIWYSIANFNYENQKDINRFVEYETNNKEKNGKDRSTSRNRSSTLQDIRRVNASQERKSESLNKESTINFKSSNLKFKQSSRSPANTRLKSPVQVEPNIQLNYNTKRLENPRSKQNRSSRNTNTSTLNERLLSNQQSKTVNSTNSYEITKNITSPKLKTSRQWYEDPRYEKYLSGEYQVHNPDNYYHVKSKPVSKELGDILFHKLLQKQGRGNNQFDANKTASDIESFIPLSPETNSHKYLTELKVSEMELDKNEPKVRKDRYNANQPVNEPPKSKLSIRNVNLQVLSQDIEKPINSNPTVISKESNFFINQENSDKRYSKNLEKSYEKEDENLYKTSSFSQRENEKLNKAAQLYRKGLEHEFSQPQNIIEAFKCYNEAGTLGHPEAIFMLSVFYEVGKVVEKNINISRNYLEQAALRGNINAASKLKNWIRCLICEEEEATSTFNPCLHKITCRNCSVKIEKSFGDCPKCRVKIQTIYHKH